MNTKKEDMFLKIAHKSRDNARTPMQWDEENVDLLQAHPGLLT